MLSSVRGGVCSHLQVCSLLLGLLSRPQLLLQLACRGLSLLQLAAQLLGSLLCLQRSGSGSLCCLLVRLRSVTAEGQGALRVPLSCPSPA